MLLNKAHFMLYTWNTLYTLNTQIMSRGLDSALCLIFMKHMFYNVEWGHGSGEPGGKLEAGDS